MQLFVHGVLSLLIAAISPAGRPVTGPYTASDSTVVIYLVRHAEKLDDSRDPPLSEAGKTRANELRHVLGEAGITHIWSTPLVRARSTAAPIAAQLSLPVEVYDASKLQEFAAMLKRSPGRHLVVGHSNTTPELVRWLGGDPGPPIVDTEYDRLYVVAVTPSAVVTSRIRFGATSP